MATYDLLVIGGGPGGYLCAERAAQGGLQVALCSSGSTWAAPASTRAVFPPRPC